LLVDEIPTVFETLPQSIKTSLVNWQGFASTLVQGIDFRVQDTEYKVSLLQQDFTREVKNTPSPEFV